MSESNREEIAKLEVLYANNPGGRVFTHLAEAYRKAGELDRARSILESGMIRHADYASAHVVLGRVLIDQGSLEGAAGEFRRVLELDPENRVALRSLGDIAQNSDPENALEHYRHLRSLDPADDDLANTITELEAQLVMQARDAEPGRPFAEGFPRTTEAPEELPAWVEERDTPAAEAPTQPTATDFGIDWQDDVEEGGLPGDLAHLTRVEEPAFSPSEADPWSVEAESTPAAEASSGEETAIAPEGEQPFDEPWATPLEAAARELEEPSIEVIEAFAVIAVPADPTANEPMVEPAAAEPEEQAAALPEFSGFEAAADASLRPKDETELFEASVPSEEPDPASEMETTFEQMLSANFGLESPLVTKASGEDLPTETLAELYRTQGFFDRAAEVYRSLLADSPGDLRLSQRLKEVEELEHAPTLEADGDPVIEFDAGAPEDDELSARVAASAEDSGPPEAWLEGVESAWTGGSGAADLDDSHYSWADEGREDDAEGATLQEYLKTLLAWRPTEPVSAAVAEIVVSATEDEDELSESFSYTVPDAPTPARAGGGTPSTRPAPVMVDDDDEPWAATPKATPLLTQMPPSPPVTSQRPSAPVPAAATRPTGNSVDDAFDEWFGGSESTKTKAETSATGSSPSSATSTPVDAEDEPDDDLEVFRSWLQSLKR